MSTALLEFLPQAPPQPGQLVLVRSRHWLVEQVVALEAASGTDAKAATDPTREPQPSAPAHTSRPSASRAHPAHRSSAPAHALGAHSGSNGTLGSSGTAYSPKGGPQAPLPAHPAHRVRLACADDDNQGAVLEVLWELELDRQILGEEAWGDLGQRGFDAPRRFAAYINTLRWGTVTATDGKLFQSPFRAGIRVDAYQMEPLRKALQLPRVNLFIADDTGLGKTIEAGLIARELLLRKKVKRIVVAAPPSVLEQWQAELEGRFGLLFVILDRAYFAQVRRERGFNVNPWRTHSRFLVSHRLLIDETYAGPLAQWLDEDRPRCQGSCRLVRGAAGPLPGRRPGRARLLLLPVGQDAPHGGRDFQHP